MPKFKSHHRGRIRQMPIFLGKFFRMFIFQSDWKVLPMAALIAALVAFVAGSSMFETMEGTVMGSMALTCVCLWNGCFNSIQVVCREREILKREHRSGMHISSYITAHMIYQAFLCLLQTLITIVVCQYAGLKFPTEGFITPWFTVDFGITMFLTTYAADMLSLMISCIVHNTTAAMTAMPLVLIFQLVFSGIMFTLSESVSKFSGLTIAKWGMRGMCAQADYNAQPMVTVWNQLYKFRYYNFMNDIPELKDAVDKIPGLDPQQTQAPILSFMQYIETNNMRDDFLYRTAAEQANPEYVHTLGNILFCWGHLVAFALLFAILAMFFLKFVDKDKR